MTSAGTLRFVDKVSIGFPEGGRLVALKVKVGDHVVPGQELAQVDNTEQQVALRKAQSAVKIEEARLAKLVANNAVETADDEHDYAGESTDVTVRIKEETVEQDKAAIDQLETKLDFDRRQLKRRQTVLAQARGCLDDLNVPPGPTEECKDRVLSRQDAVEEAKRDIVDHKADLDAAENKLDVDRQSQQSSVVSAERSQASAKNAEDRAKSERPYDITVQQQVLEQARIDAEVSQQKLDKTFKPSSYSGTVDGIHGRVGQIMTASYGTSASGKPASEDAPTGDSLITLKDVNAYQVVVPFQESDGKRITPEQTVEVSYPDKPGITSPARVAAIEPPVPGVNNGYLVTVVLKAARPDLEDGMAARVAVAVDKIDNTLMLPASAVRVNGRTGSVAVQQPDGTVRQTSVELGMIGDRSVQILSGVKAADQVRTVFPN